MGRYVRRELGRYGVDTSFVRTIAGEMRTSLAVVETRIENCQSVIYRNGAADFALQADHLKDIAFGDYAALIVTGTALAVEPSRSGARLAMLRARQAGVGVILDVDYRPYSWASAAEAARVCHDAARASDIVVGNDVEFDVMAGGAGGLDLARWLATDRHAVIYKMGEKGSTSFSEGRSFDTPIDSVEALKPTGAGDAFMAGLVTGLASGLGLAAAVRQTGDRCFVAHGAGEAGDIVDRMLLVFVDADAATADCRSQAG